MKTNTSSKEPTSSILTAIQDNEDSHSEWKGSIHKMAKHENSKVSQIS